VLFSRLHLELLSKTAAHYEEESIPGAQHRRDAENSAERIRILPNRRQ
jgi:hypothetical protein